MMLVFQLCKVGIIERNKFVCPFQQPQMRDSPPALYQEEKESEGETNY